MSVYSKSFGKYKKSNSTCDTEARCLLSERYHKDQLFMFLDKKGDSKLCLYLSERKLYIQTSLFMHETQIFNFKFLYLDIV